MNKKNVDEHDSSGGDNMPILLNIWILYGSFDDDSYDDHMPGFLDRC